MPTLKFGKNHYIIESAGCSRCAHLEILAHPIRFDESFSLVVGQPTILNGHNSMYLACSGNEKTLSHEDIANSVNTI
jgi:hypothetical protein